MKNNTLNEIAKVLKEKQNILIYPHISMDGDALGSAAALCKGLRDLGKNCYILIEDDIPGNLLFLDKGYTTNDQHMIETAEVSVCVDCGEEKRFPKRAEKFRQAGITVCIDHHATTKFICDYNYVDSSRAATGELIYDLLCILGVAIDKEIGEAIFAAITSDTGNFQYSNTSKRSHEIVAALYDAGIDANRVSIALYENVRLEKIRIKNKILSTMELFCDGRAAVCYMTEAMLAESGAASDETDGVVQELRSINGVEIAAFLKEQSEGKVKVSLRSKEYADVAVIASAFGGGGHVRAAGCALECGLEEAVNRIKESIKESIEL